MKCAIWMLMAVSSVVLGGEAGQAAPTAPPEPGTDANAPRIERLPDGRFRLPDGRIVPEVHMRAPGSTCYYIRTLRPLAGGSEPRRGLIPLQARVGPLVRGPDCTSVGTLMPVPAEVPQKLVPEPQRESGP
jgi:hypothetical protein